jgi:hypothetical protein
MPCALANQVNGTAFPRIRPRSWTLIGYTSLLPNVRSVTLKGCSPLARWPDRPPKDATMCRLAGSRSWGRYTVCWLIPLVVAFTLKAPLRAQTATGRIAGLLEDPSGAIVPGGEIEIRNLDSGLTKSAVRRAPPVAEPVARLGAPDPYPGVSIGDRTAAPTETDHRAT